MEDHDKLLDAQISLLLQGDTFDLADLGGPAPELSTGLILTWQDRLVFTLEPNALPLGARGQQDVLAFVGVGGHLDPGETWGQAVVREAMEEARCAVSLDDSTVTYLCLQGQEPLPIAYRWREPIRPLLVWVATFMLRRGPERRRVPVTVVNAVFRAVALSQPTPGAEVSALLTLDREALLYTYAEPRPLAELQARGVQVIGPTPPPGTVLAPGGSAYFYAQWLTWQASNAGAAAIT